MVEVVGSEHLDEARKAGRGVIFSRPTWDVLRLPASTLPPAAISPPPIGHPSRRPCRPWILLGRQRERLHLAPTNLQGVRSLVKALKRQEMVILVPDQAPKEGEGVWLRFSVATPTP